jgi:tRNA (guanine37-N1)-methyltransferase
MPKKAKKYIDLVSIFPEVCIPYINSSILGRAQKNGIVSIKSHDLRSFTKDKHRKVDDTPYGGGPGMVMKVEPFDRAIKCIRKKNKKTRIITTSASAKSFSQKDARRLVKYDQLIFLCGRYEGIDARVEDKLSDESFSIGPYVLTGGELPALIMADSIIRLIPGVLGSKESLDMESHTEDGLLEYPHYTKPEIYNKWKVPKVLLSGDHKKIDEWKRKRMK